MISCLARLCEGGDTALDMALKAGCQEAVVLLKDHGGRRGEELEEEGSGQPAMVSLEEAAVMGDSQRLGEALVQGARCTARVLHLVMRREQEGQIPGSSWQNIWIFPLLVQEVS